MQRADIEPTGCASILRAVVRCEDSESLLRELARGDGTEDSAISVRIQLFAAIENKGAASLHEELVVRWPESIEIRNDSRHVEQSHGSQLEGPLSALAHDAKELREDASVAPVVFIVYRRLAPVAGVTPQHLRTRDWAYDPP